MQKLKSLLTSKEMYVGLAVGIIVGVAYAVRWAFVRKAASYLPGSATKPAAAA